MTAGTDEEPLYCEQCAESVERKATIRTETMGDLDPTKWQSLCCPTCGKRLQTVFVGGEDAGNS